MNESTALNHSARASLHLISLQRHFQTLLVLKASLAPETHLSNIALSSSHPEQGVVSIFSPVKMALAPAMKAMACSVSLNSCRPAARRMMVLGRTIRAVAMVRRTVWTLTGSLPSRGVPGIGTSVLTGKDSGCSGILHRSGQPCFCARR